MKKILIHTVFNMLVLSIFASAQFRIKIPKIKTPKVTKTNSQAHTSNENRNLAIDDGFTFFEAEPVEGRNPQEQGNIDLGWTIKSYIRVLGEFPNRSGFSVAVRKEGRVVAKTRCEGRSYPAAYDRDKPGDKYLVYKFPANGCSNKKKIIKGTGKFDVDVFVFDGDTDQETLLRTYKIDVKRSPRVRGSTTKPQPDVAHYYISRHAEVSSAILYLRDRRLRNYFVSSKTDGALDANTVELYFSYSPKRAEVLPSGYLKCMVNGKPLRLPGQEGYSDAVRVDPQRQEYAVYTDRIAARYRRGAPYREDIIFRQVRAELPLGWASPRQHARIDMLEENGDWKCNFNIEGETIRTFRWKIAGGKIVPLPEQANGIVNLYHGGYLVTAEIPAGGSPYDHRLTPVPGGGFFYGIPWTSTEGKTAAAKVPKKGRAFHMPSNRSN